MFAKMVLPRLGGAPSVWSVAMVFFQAALLAGYGYAHLLSRTLPPSRAALVHFILLGGAALTLPLGIAAGFDIPPSTNVGVWLIALFTVSIGLPFAALAATAPLLQKWFAASGHDRAGNPYVLYAASNLGSFAALVAYPFLIEPALPLGVQARVWSFGFAALAIFMSVAALVVARAALRNDVTEDAADKVRNADRLCWIALAAIPSGLVIAVTAYFTTDIAAAPFIWVAPLALYLLTFVAVFREKPWVQIETVARFVPIIVAPLAISLLGFFRLPLYVAAPLNLAVFVALTLLCHGELYRRRPAPYHLTEFYFWTSFGGVLGGIFAGLVAPYVFNQHL